MAGVNSCPYHLCVSADSADDADAAASTQLFDPGDEITVRKHIIAFRLHYDHEIALAFHVKQYASLAFTLDEEGMKVVDRLFLGVLQRNADADRTRQCNLGFFERQYLGGG